MLKQTSNLLLIIFSLFIIAITFSCNRNQVFQEYIEVDKNIWNNENILEFDFVINDTISSYDFYINIRNATHYPFSNLWMFLTTYAPDTIIPPQRDTLEVILADKTGKWLGDGLGDIWDNQVLYKKHIRFPNSGTYNIKIEQAMRIQHLNGIMDVGVLIEKVEK